MCLNVSGEVGFFFDSRRMNVVVTRVWKYCCFIIDSDIVSSDRFLVILVEYFEIYGDVVLVVVYVS